MDLVAKLQLKAGQQIEAVLVPPSVAPALAGLTGAGDGAPEPALVVFTVDRATLEARQAVIVASASQDRLTWVCYPKSGQLGTDLNRDSLAAQLREHGVQPVRQIAIDGVWSALRFRPA